MSQNLNLIDINQNEINGELVKTVSARELHEFLESRQDFSTWIKNRIKKYNLLENQDYIVFHNFVENLQGGRPSLEYYLTLDRAKELSMLENNQRGREARLYFIECERRAKQAAPQMNLANALEDPLYIKKLLLESITQLETLKSEVSTLKPKAMALDNLQRLDGLVGITEAAKILEVGRNNLTDYLRKYKWVYKRGPKSPLLPFQDKIKKGLMDCTTITIQTKDGTEMLLPSTKFTAKGLVCLREELYGKAQ
ncbi:antA/AntB antirepressor family protein [Bartonella sp. 220]|uniref:antA/AntB antirepressor family protein n=1 Tax=Bartonella sp. 220B TaxID=2967260 RepID=UPI0022A9CB35|nr:antA/AntB antirepressor family protein [Bartonella sp. 220B]MCZ2159188.1 antA/AntB antirepressor family protein [Bartonella sp. 220B]